MAFGNEEVQMELRARPLLVCLALFAVTKVISSRHLYPASLDVVGHSLPRAETIVSHLLLSTIGQALIPTTSQICYVALGYTALSVGLTAINVYIRSQRPTSLGRDRTNTSASILRVLQLTTTVLAIQRACFAFPRVPYLAASNDLRVLNATDSVSGLVMVADNLKDGYRFIRCDHSLLGGRWLRLDEDAEVNELGDT